MAENQGQAGDDDADSGHIEILVEGSHEDIDTMTTAIDKLALDAHVPIRSAVVDPSLDSALNDAVLVAASGGTIAAVASVLVEVIRSRRVKLTWRSGDSELHYEGPLGHTETLQELSDGLTGAGRRQLSASDPVPLDPGPAQPAGREPEDGVEGVF